MDYRKKLDNPVEPSKFITIFVIRSSLARIIREIDKANICEKIGIFALYYPVSHGDVFALFNRTRDW